MVSRSSHPAPSCVDNFATSSTDVQLLVGRILMSYLFLSAGWGKLTNVVGTAAYFTALGMPSPSVMSYLVGALEVAVGVALILGLATRYVAIVIFIFVLIATAFAHRYWTYAAEAQRAQFIQFTKNLAIMSGSLFLLVVGAGRFSIDAMLAKKQ
jgi:putative oxidoreductase